jgi:isoamyl acetate esterase
MKPAAIKVALIGDSIRLNAQRFVREGLPSDFELRAPAENCESSRKVLANMREWVPAGAADLVHINCGLHDLRHDPGCARPITSLEDYGRHLREIFAYLATMGATVVWATTTPVDEVLHNTNKASRRYRSDVLDYNECALAVAREFGARIHDLHARLMQAGLAQLLLSDGVHFNETGNALIGCSIAESILAASRARELAGAFEVSR